jgi:hypothetical protein
MTIALHTDRRSLIFIRIGALAKSMLDSERSEESNSAQGKLRDEATVSNVKISGGSIEGSRDDYD